ncbi:MAG: response regulator [Gammaproteobacteria bacterium]|nr:MAG: response regulator [Gammaproteobacteria bacterium]
MQGKNILIVEDDMNLSHAIAGTIRDHGFTAFESSSPMSAMGLLGRERIDMVLSDIQFDKTVDGNDPITDGYELLDAIKQKYLSLPVVLMTAYGTIEKAVSCIKNGASDYLVKPFDVDLLLNIVKSNIQVKFSRANNGDNYISVDKKSIDTKKIARRVATTSVSVFIRGESGTGKEVLARFVHENSPRSGQPFVAINCAAIPENMLEAVLFGYEKGAYTGAHQAKAGKFEEAQQGTLLLDEISEMDLALQAKLLRVLQEKQVERLGGKKLIDLDVRIIATSNRNLKDEVKKGTFREDLFYRLNVFPITLHPLRDRIGDILPLAYMLLHKHSPNKALELSEGARESLMKNNWAGNVRELENVIQRSIVLCSGTVIEEDLLELDELESANEETVTNLTTDLKSHEQDLILQALVSEHGNRKLVAERLGISPRTLRYKIAKMKDQGVPVPSAYRSV